MAEKILYYLGAGASAQALPTVKASSDGTNKGLSYSLNYLAKRIRDTAYKPEKITKQLEDLCNDLDWLAKSADEFNTIDTYAKYLYMTNKSLYEKLKFTLSVYFTYEQTFEGKLDKRYLVWLTSILDKKLFPSNVKILSWNYDFQIQIAAEYYQKESHIYIAIQLLIPHPRL